MYTYYKTGQAAIIRVRLFDTLNYPVPGIAQASTTVGIIYPNGTTATLTAGTQYSWAEITTGAFSGLGVYTLTLAASVITTAGEHTVAITGGTGTSVHEFSVWGSFPVDAQINVEVTRKMLTNKAIVTAGNQYVVYEDDGTTVFKTFNLQDVNGTPSNTSVFRKIPV